MHHLSICNALCTKAFTRFQKHQTYLGVAYPTFAFFSLPPKELALSEAKSKKGKWELIQGNAHSASMPLASLWYSAKPGRHQTRDCQWPRNLPSPRVSWGSQTSFMTVPRPQLDPLVWSLIYTWYWCSVLNVYLLHVKAQQYINFLPSTNKIKLFELVKYFLFSHKYTRSSLCTYSSTDHITFAKAASMSQ